MDCEWYKRESTPTSQPDEVTGDEKEDDRHSQLQTSNGNSKSRVQNPSKPEPSKQKVPKKNSEDRAEFWKDKAEMSEPLTSLVEAVRRNKSSNKSPMKEIAVTPVPVDSSDSDSEVPKFQVKKHSHTGGKRDSNSTKLRRLQDTQERTVKFYGDLNLPAPAPVIGSSTESNNKFGNLSAQPVIGSSGKIFGGPVWFSLVASEDKDGSLPVSYIEKYIAKKLDLPSDAQVEISLWGQPVLSSWKLQNLVEMWLQTMPKDEKIHTSVGSSAKDFVMVLSYGL
ncbi:unnamed protein product [Lupinus luteus]|uniref:Uncharacterized protein n=1 Tax=Lupinus luteus TaxID=3873 RepID=A0AAV1XHV8_LUPLU